MQVSWLFFLACLGATPGCGSSSDDEPGTGGSSGGGGSTTELTPAPNIDVKTCAAILEGDVNASDLCWDCCTLRPEVVASSFIHQGQCTCAELREDDPGQTICASAIADGDTCAMCCSDNDFLTSGWVGSDGTTAGACGCGSHQDRTVCAASAQSQDACDACCMHAGYIGTGFGSGICWCSGP